MLTEPRQQLSDLGILDDLTDVLNDLGDLALEYPTVGDPLGYYREASAIAEVAGLAPLHARALAGQGRCLLRTDVGAATAILREALAIHQRLGLPATDIAELLAGINDMEPHPTNQ